MKKSLILIVLSIFVSLATFSQAIQNGVAKEYNDKNKKTPLSNVEIIVNNAGSNTSDKNGAFKLSFRTLKPGAKVEIRKIEKDGYEVFNKEALDEWRIANDGSVFTIVLCKSAKFKALKDKYNAIASKSYKEQKAKEEARLVALLKENKIDKIEYDKKLKALQEKYDEQLENLDNYIDHFARIDLSELLGPERKIIELVQAGKIDEAIRAYENMHLESKFATAVDNINKADDAINALEQVKSKNKDARNNLFTQIQNEIGVLKLKGGSESFNTIADKLKFCADKDSTNVIISGELADFLISQTRYQEAEKYWLRLADIYSASKDHNVEYARSMNNLGLIYENTQRFDKAEEVYKAAIVALKSDSAEQSSDIVLTRITYMKDLADMYNTKNEFAKAEELLKNSIDLLNLLKTNDNSTLLSKTERNLYLVMGQTYIAMRKYDEAKKALDYSLEIAMNSLRADSLASYQDLTVIYTALGSYWDRLNDNVKALEFFNKSKDVFEKLYAINPEKYAKDFAITLSNIATVKNKLDDVKGAIQTMTQSKEIIERMLKKYPSVYRKEYADILYKIAVIYNAQHNNAKAIEFSLQSLSQIDTLYQYNPDVYADMLRRTYYFIGIEYNDLGKPDSAMPYIEKALLIAEKLYHKDPQVYSKKYTGILNEIGNMQAVAKQYAEAEVTYKKIIAIRKIDYEHYPHANCLSYMTAVYNLAALYADETKYDAAISNYRTALTIVKKEREETHGFSATYEAQCLESLATCYVKTQMWNKADSCFEAALSIFNKLYLEAPSNYGYNLANIAINYSSALMERREYTKAELILNDALAKFIKSTYRDGDSNLQFFKSSLEQNIGYCLVMQKKDMARAEKLLSDNLATQKALYTAQPDVYVQYYAEAIKMMQIYYSQINNFEKAEALAKENIKLLSELIQKYGDIFVIDYYDAYKKLGGVLFSEKKYQESIISFSKAIEIIEQHKETFANYPLQYFSTMAAVGVAFYKVNNISEARSYIDKAYIEALKCNKTTPDEKYDLHFIMESKGLIYTGDNDYKSALRIWKQIIKEDPLYLEENNNSELYDSLKAKKLVE